MNEKYLKEKLLSLLTVEKTDRSVSVTVPEFFAATGDDLQLTFLYSDEVFYVHDNGGAVAQLKKQIENADTIQRTLKKVGEKVSFDGERMVGAFCQAHTFFRYMQMLVFIANADLYCDCLDEDGLRFDNDILLPTDEKLETLDRDVLFECLDSGIFCSLNADGSYRLSLAMFYSTFSTYVSYRVELTDERVMVSDFHKGKIEGELFESFYWDHDDTADYADEINRYGCRFGVEFDGKDIFVTDSSEHLNKAFWGFFNMAVLMSELGNRIELPR